MRKKKYDIGTAYTMLLPMVALLTIFVMIPFVYAVVVSFYDWSFYQESTFVGLDNFRMVLHDPYFYKAIKVGLKYAIIVMPVQMVMAFFLAHVIRNMKGISASLVKTAIYIPNVIAGILAAVIFSFIYNFDGGLLNYFVGLFGVENQAWLAEVKYSLYAMTVPGIWVGFGITTLIMLAGLLDIPESYYEAADLEGAGTFDKMLHITIPLLKNVTVYLLVTGFIAQIQQLDLALIMTGGGPVNETLTPTLYIFNHFRDDDTMGMTIASALLLFIVLGTISAIIFRVINSDKAVDG
jgi:multiple sugar transport system permease protein